MTEQQIAAEALRAEVEEGIATAEALFARLDAQSRDEIGITRAPYGEAEQAAHDTVAQTARELGLEIDIDDALNTYMTLPGRDRDGPGIIAGSHLDSVPQGGNYDGAAGVIGGIMALSALRRCGITPRHDISAMAIRAEETAWFSGYHVGSRAALGLLPPTELDTARRSDTGLTLADHMAAAGANVSALRDGARHLDPARLTAYLEMHIEQGPVLEAQDLPVGIVTGIRGNFRYRDARCVGQYAHAGGMPGTMRRDAVMAMAEYVAAMENDWARLEGEGQDLVVTVGKLFTDGAAHSHSKVPGLVNFSLEVRSYQEEALEAMHACVLRQANEISNRRKLTIDLGARTSEHPVAMDDGLRRHLTEGCKALGIPHMDLPSGGGHDAGDFAAAGVPSAMIFLRNPHGSHNPDEDMTMEDFALGTTLLAWTLARIG